MVLIEHEDGIFGGEAGSYALSLVHELRQPFVVTLHTVPSTPTPRQRTSSPSCVTAPHIADATSTGDSIQDAEGSAPDDRPPQGRTVLSTFGLVLGVTRLRARTTTVKRLREPWRCGRIRSVIPHRAESRCCAGTLRAPRGRPSGRDDDVPGGRHPVQANRG